MALRGRRMTYAATVLADSPAGYWPPNDASGTSANDLSGNGNAGTYSGLFALAQAGLLPGSPDTCAKFTGGSDGSLRGSPRPRRSGVVVRGMVNLTSWAEYAGLVDDIGRTHSALLDAGAANDVYFIGGGATVAALAFPATITLSALHHIVFTCAGPSANCIAYLDGAGGTPQPRGAGVTHANSWTICLRPGPFVHSRVGSLQRGNYVLGSGER